jgi:type III secretory pathway component EscS
MNALISEALFLSLTLSLIPMVFISVTAGAVTLIQSITQLQEQSLVHLSRLVVMGALIMFGGSAAFSAVAELFRKVAALCALHNGGY